MRQMEKGLLLLLEDFHKGKLQVFGKDCTFDQMDQVRERQERLSRLHFDLDAQQQMYKPDSDDAKELALRYVPQVIMLSQNIVCFCKTISQCRRCLCIWCSSWTSSYYRNLNKLVENLEDLNSAVHELKSGAVAPKTMTGQSPKRKDKGKLNINN